MNLLTQVLPGLRDLRTPLAAGYVWLAALAVVFSQDLAELSARILHRFQAFDITGKGFAALTVWGALTFVCYLIGTLSQGIGHLMGGIVNLAWGKFRRSGEMSRRMSLLNESVYQDLSNRFLTEESFREELIELLDIDSASLCLQAALGSSTAGVVSLGGQLWHLPLERDLPTGTDEAETKIFAQLIVEKGRRNELIRRELFRLMVDQRTYVAEMMRELDTAPERLLITSTLAFERWDRLRAESEFRAGLVLPFGMLPVAVWSLAREAVSARSQFSGPSTLILAVAALPSLLLLWLASEKRKDADRQLLAAWRAGVIDSPSTSDLKRKAVRLETSRLRLSDGSDYARKWRAKNDERSRTERDRRRDRIHELLAEESFQDKSLPHDRRVTRLVEKLFQYEPPEGEPDPPWWYSGRQTTPAESPAWKGRLHAEIEEILDWTGG